MKKCWFMLLASLSLALMLIGCGNGGGEEDYIEAAQQPVTPVQQPVTPVQQAEQATIISGSPANGATGVDVSTVISITFSENIVALSTNFAVVANNTAIDGTLVTNGATMTFTPSAILPYGANVTVAVSGVSDSAGNILQVTHSAGFTTQAAPAVDTTPPFVVATAPASNAVGVPTNSVIGITANETLQANIGTVTLTQGTTVIPCTATFNGANIAITPTSVLVANMTFTVKVNGLMDMAGNEIAQGVEYQFTTSIWSAPMVFANTSASLYSVAPGLVTWQNTIGQITVYSKPTNRWDVQLRWQGIPIEAGHTYQATFSCTGGGSVDVLLKKNVANYDEYASKQIICDGEKSIDLIPSQSDVAARLEFQFGLQQIAYPAVFTINNVVLNKIN